MDQNNTVHRNSMYVWITVIIVYVQASNLGYNLNSLTGVFDR